MRRRAAGGGVGASAEKLSVARSMRAEATAAEAVLWSALRGRRLAGWKFRRQHVVAGYIVDFDCPELRLVLEVDGAVHQARVVEDRRRDEALARLGTHVLRLSNAQVLERLDDALMRTSLVCESISLTAVQRAIKSEARASRSRSRRRPRSCAGSSRSGSQNGEPA